MKKNKKNLPINTIYTLVAILICSISVGFAAMSSTLSISGIASVAPHGIIKITNVRLYETLNGATEVTPVSYANLLMSMEYELTTADSQITYEVTIENQTTTNQIYKGLTAIRNDAVGVEVYEIGINEGDVINVGQNRTFIVTMFLGGDIMAPSLSTTLIDLLFMFETTNNTDLVAEDSLLLSLNGQDRIYNGTWYDRSQHQNVELENVTSNLDNNAYTFSGTNSCALTNRTIIPSTGDFTAETLITTGSDVSGDKAILTQKLMGLDDVGRTKPFNIYNASGASIIRAFIIGSANRTTITPTYVSSLTANTTYHLALTKNGTNLYLYVNGYLIAQAVMNAEDVISLGTTQIGCYDSISSQNFIGEMHALRIYNRALDADEILSNFLSQKVAETIDDTLTNYIKTNHIVSSGDGLYYLAEEDRYVYKGNNPNNRLLMGGDLFRILSIEPDDTLKVVKVSDISSQVPFDEPGYRTTVENPYCTSASSLAGDNTYFGCNAWGIHTNILDNAAYYTTKSASIVNYLNNDIYNAFTSDVTNRIIEKDFNVGLVTSNDLSSIRTEEKVLKWTGKVGTLTVSDVMDAGSNTSIINSNPDNYLAKLSNSNLFIWTANGKTTNTYDVWTIVNGSNISQRRASRTSQVVSTSVTAYFGVLPVIYIDGRLDASGDGTSQTPFAFQQALSV